MKIVFKGEGIAGTDVNTPGDLHFLNCVSSLTEKAPRCAGVVSGEAKVHNVKIGVSIPSMNLEKEMSFERIDCPDSCPRDEENQRKRCLIGVN